MELLMLLMAIEIIVLYLGLRKIADRVARQNDEQARHREQLAMIADSLDKIGGHLRRRNSDDTNV